MGRELSIIMKKIGKLLKEKRQLMKISQWELASLVGCSRVSIQQYETDRKAPSIYMADRLLKALGATVCIGLVNTEIVKRKEDSQ